MRTLIVGSGAAGLTLSLLLARRGHRVTVYDIQPSAGGYLRRFSRGGLRFDTGYHFTGGATGIMAEIGEDLGISDRVKYLPVAQKLVLKNGETVIDIPPGSGHDGTRDAILAAFPGSGRAVNAFFQTEREIWDASPFSTLGKTGDGLSISRYDTVTVGEYCQKIGLSGTARTACIATAMCHGSLPCETPMSFHCRVGYGLHRDLSRPVAGGDALLSALLEKCAGYGVEIHTGKTLLPPDAPDGDGNCRLFRTADGDALDIDRAYFTIHPRAVFDLMPPEVKRACYLRRVSRLQESISFFCSYYAVAEGHEVPDGLVSYFTSDDLDDILLDGRKGHSTGMMFSSEPDAAGGIRQTVCAFRTMREVPEGCRAPRPRRHCEPYQEFKQRILDETTGEITACYPGLTGHLVPIDCGTPLTCRDYDPPTGSAYGCRCITGQSRIFGRLPLGNCFAAGQSALVPGVLGTMLSAYALDGFAG